MATQQEKTKPVGTKKTLSKAKLAAKLQLEADPANQLQDVEERRTRLKALIVLGKERGYLTYAEINDHLPEMLEVEQIEGVVSMINDMGISVSDQAPDAENMVMLEGVVVVVDEDAVEAAEAALAASTVDSDFGRTTDPVRMYMREMGTVGLLTRQDEIVIAKRIEEGLKHMIQAVSACPATIAEILALAEKVKLDEMRIDEVIDGFIEIEDETIVNEELIEEEVDEDEEEDDEEEESAEDREAAVAANLAQLKIDALERFEIISDLFGKMGKAYEKFGYRSKQYDKFQEQISHELMQFRFSAKQVDKLCDTMRSLVEEVRAHERSIQDLCVVKARMPRQHFIKMFVSNEDNLKWVDQEIIAKKPYSETLMRFQAIIS